MSESAPLDGTRCGGAVCATPATAVITSVVLVELSSGITQGFLPPLLKGLTGALDVTVAELNWISIANLLASVVFTSVLSRVGDLYGHRRILRWNLAVVLLGSLLVGLSRSLGMLLAGQLLQGAVAGFFPLLVGILRNSRGDAENRRGISFMIAALVTGIAVGTVASGTVAQYVASPTAALWVPALAATISLTVTWPLLPASNHRPDGSVDWAGVALLGTGLAAVLLGLGQGGTPGWEWTSLRTLGCLLGGVLILAVWGLVELRTPHAVVDVRMFLHRNVIVVCLVTAASTFCMFGLLVANPVFLGTSDKEAGYGLGLGPLQVAVALVPNLLALALGSLLAPKIAARITDRLTLTAGSLLMGTGYIAELAWHTMLWPFLAATAVAGAGTGLLQHSCRTLAVEMVPRDRTAVGSGINELLINVGGSLGAAAVLTVFAARTPVGRQLPELTAYTTAWLMCTAICLVGAAIALRYRGAQAADQHDAQESSYA